MLKRISGILLAAVLMLSTFAGCGSSSKDATSANYEGIQAASAKAPVNQVKTTSSINGSADNYSSEAERDGAYNGEGKAPETKAEEPKDVLADSLAGTGGNIESISNAILAERKIIRSANLTIEVENFDDAFKNINSIILGIGIVQESNINTEKVYYKDETKLIKNGTIILRVYKEKFDSVINNLKGIGNVYNESINGQDVTDRFVDTESRLRLLKLEQSRLEAYLIKLEDLDKIFRTESRLTEIRQEIESLTGNLNKMSSLVELSTITVTMNEKRPGSDDKPQPLTYGQKLLNKLESSMEGVVTFLGELLIFIISAIPVIILLGLFVLLGVFIYRRIPKKSKEAPTVVKRYNTDDKKEE